MTTLNLLLYASSVLVHLTPFAKYEFYIGHGICFLTWGYRATLIMNGSDPEAVSREQRASRVDPLDKHQQLSAFYARFARAFERRRCLNAADGWVEWKGEGKPNPKFYIDRRDGALICFAGLWDRCHTDDSSIESFTMVTQPPGALSDVHERAPVVLTQADWAR